MASGLGWRRTHLARYGSRLIEFGLGLARADDAGAFLENAGAFLETGTPRNVPYYERFGFRSVDDADADGGPHIWFMRWDPSDTAVTGT